jgi:putative toxin-antitoxin system antitoxin component (TIGR02293 family)
MANERSTTAPGRKTRKNDDDSMKRLLVHWSGSGFTEMRKPRRAARAAAPTHHRGASLGFAPLDQRESIGIIRAGLPMAAYDHLCETLGISAARLAEISGIAQRTLARRRQEGRLGFEESERVFRVAMLFDRSVEVLGDVPAARQWITAPAPALGGESPLDYARTAIGAREAEDLLGRLEQGVFS